MVYLIPSPRRADWCGGDFMFTSLPLPWGYVESYQRRGGGGMLCVYSPQIPYFSSNPLAIWEKKGYNIRDCESFHQERNFTMNKLNKLAGFAGVKGPVLTIVMDGVGIAPDTAGNAVSLAYTPTLDRIMKEYPMVSLKAHGTAVGLPSDDDMGNSEVGHNALGAGQVFAQGAKLVTQSIESGKMFASDTWKTQIGRAHV